VTERNAITEFAAAHVRRRRVAVWLVVLLAIGAAIAAFTVDVRHVITRVDAVTGSVEKETKGRFTGSKKVVKESSALEARLRQAGIVWKADWRLLSDCSETAVGYVTSRACATAPEVFRLRAMKEFVEQASDAEIRAFVGVMDKGSEEEQRAAVKLAGERVFGKEE